MQSGSNGIIILTSLFSTMITFILIYCLLICTYSQCVRFERIPNQVWSFIHRLIKNILGFAYWYEKQHGVCASPNCPPKSVLKSNFDSAITRTCHLPSCPDVNICLWLVFQIINIILELKVTVKLRQNL